MMAGAGCTARQLFGVATWDVAAQQHPGIEISKHEFTVRLALLCVLFGCTAGRHVCEAWFAEVSCLQSAGHRGALIVIAADPRGFSGADGAL